MTKKALDARVQAVKDDRVKASANLVVARFWQDKLTSSELADGLRDARGSGPQADVAKERIAKSFHGFILKKASAHINYRTDDLRRQRFDELVSAGMLGLFKAVSRWDPQSNSGAVGFITKHIEGAIRAEAKKFRRNGAAGETRLQASVYSNSGLTVEKASERLGREVTEAEIEEARRDNMEATADVRSYFELSTDDKEAEEGKERGLVTQLPAPFEEGQEPGQIVSLAADDTAPGWLERRYGAIHLRGLGDDADRRARERRDAVGRRQYALELSAKDRAKLPSFVEVIFPDGSFIEGDNRQPFWLVPGSMPEGDTRQTFYMPASVDKLINLATGNRDKSRVGLHRYTTDTKLHIRAKTVASHLYLRPSKWWPDTGRAARYRIIVDAAIIIGRRLLAGTPSPLLNFCREIGMAPETMAKVMFLAAYPWRKPKLKPPK
jgi:DNA-directed RNA polymerase specialized sigma subunit